MTPREFKRGGVERLAQGMFVGHGQHDCQELLSHLLDGLHEDLNCGECVGCQARVATTVVRLARSASATFVCGNLC